MISNQSLQRFFYVIKQLCFLSHGCNLFHIKTFFAPQKKRVPPPWQDSFLHKSHIINMNKVSVYQYKKSDHPAQESLIIRTVRLHAGSLLLHQRQIQCPDIFLAGIFRIARCACIVKCGIYQEIKIFFFCDLF